MAKMKKGLILLVAILTFALFYAGCERLLCSKSLHGTMQAREFYAQPEDTIDVAFVGASHAHCVINTATLWEEYGIASYDYSAAEQPLWITCDYLKELCKYQKPKLIVLDLFAPAHFHEDYQYNYLYESVDGFRFSANKLSFLRAACEWDHLSSVFPTFLNWHAHYEELTDEDWDYFTRSKRERAAYKGYRPYYSASTQERPVHDVQTGGGLSAKSEEYLKRIIDYTQEQEIPLLLAVIPFISTDEDEMVFRRIQEVAYGTEAAFRNFNEYYDEIGLDFENDFYDYSHLNYRGGTKFTKWLGAELLASYDLPDRRGLPEWESWDRNVELVAETARENGVEP